MKKLLVLSLAACVFSLAASAQTERTTVEPGPKHEHHHKGGHDRKEMMKQLNLTKEQRAQMKAQHKEMKMRKDELKKQDNISVKEMREKQKALRDEQRTKTDAILTPEQRTKRDELKKQRMSQKANKTPGQGNQ